MNSLPFAQFPSVALRRFRELGVMPAGSERPAHHHESKHQEDPEDDCGHPALAKLTLDAVAALKGGV